MHENLPREILTKEWIPAPMRRVMSLATRAFQRIACRSIPTVFAEQSYARDFPRARDGVVVRNFPLLDQLLEVAVPKRDRFTIGYVGVVAAERGVDVLLEAARRLNATGAACDVCLIGPIRTAADELPAFRSGIQDGWLDAPGRLQPDEAWARVAACQVGVAVLRPSPNFVESYPTKLFEYMALGLPVIVSDFPLWRDVVEGAGCGLIVDPADVDAVAAAIRWIHDHPYEAARMGERGRSATRAQYDWRSEFPKLHALYERVLAR
jgi:glycosyltransferase involved in cell wall biosynthesis